MVAKGTNYQWTGPSLALSYIGQRVYAFSGLKTVNNTNVDLLSFNTATNALAVLFEWGCDGVDASSGAITYQITLNGNIVLYKRVGAAGADNRDDLVVGTNQINMILPPYSDVVFNIQNDAATNVESTVWLTGKIVE